MLLYLDSYYSHVFNKSIVELQAFQQNTGVYVTECKIAFDKKRVLTSGFEMGNEFVCVDKLL